jgi:hypothetical protein
VAAVKSVGCQSYVVYHGRRALAIVSGVQVGQSIPRAPPCLRRIGSCLASTCGDCPGNVGSVDRCPEFAMDLALRRTVPTSEKCSESPLDFTSSHVLSNACDKGSTLAEIQLRDRRYTAIPRQYGCAAPSKVSDRSLSSALYYVPLRTGGRSMDGDLPAFLLDSTFSRDYHHLTSQPTSFRIRSGCPYPRPSHHFHYTAPRSGTSSPCSYLCAISCNDIARLRLVQHTESCRTSPFVVITTCPSSNRDLVTSCGASQLYHRLVRARAKEYRS